MVLEASLLTAVGVVGILRCQDASRWWLGPYRHLSCLPVDLMVTEQMVQISFKKLCLKKKKNKKKEALPYNLSGRPQKSG